MILFIRATLLFNIADKASERLDFNRTQPFRVNPFPLLSIILIFLFYKPLSKKLEERAKVISFNL